MQVWETEDPSKTARVGGMHASESNKPNTIHISCCMTWLSTKEERDKYTEAELGGKGEREPFVLQTYIRF